LKQQNVGIEFFENICGRLYPLRLFFRRRFTSRPIWEPFQIPSCDANLGGFRGLTEGGANEKERDESE
jgi:hypothetical protein